MCEREGGEGGEEGGGKERADILKCASPYREVVFEIPATLDGQVAIREVR